MLCDELKSLWVYSRDIDENCDEEFVNFAKENGYEELVAKSDVDAAIAELKQKLEDAGMRERRLKRALWLTRAFRARDIQRWWIAATCSKTTERACSVWKNVERKCRAKAEEYK